MKLKSIISCGLLLLGVGAATTSCEDMFTPENKLVTTELAPQDTLYQMMGIIQRMQKLTDRTVLLGEIRADLIQVQTTANDYIQQLASNSNILPWDEATKTGNIYNNVSDYYAVINSCNIYLANVDKELKTHGDLYYEREICAAKCFRAWCYLELAKIYGEVPFVTEPVTSASAAEDITSSGSKAGLNEICSYLINDIQEYASKNKNMDFRPEYGSTTWNGLRFSNFFIPARVMLAELYLWRGSITGSVSDYTKAAGLYHDFFCFTGEERSVGMYTRGSVQRPSEPTISYWSNRQFDGRPSNSSYGVMSFGHEVTSQNIAILPMDTIEFYGNVADVRAVFNSMYKNDYYPAVLPSERLRSLVRDQKVCYYDYQTNQAFVDHAPQDKNKLVDDVYIGDLRFSSVYQTASNIANTQYNANFNSTLTFITKWAGGSQLLTNDKRQDYIPLFRTNILYLHMAEALNRAGFPETAFAVLKHGLTYETMMNRDIISQDEYDRLCAIKTLGFSTIEPKAIASNARNSFVVWPSTVFGNINLKSTGLPNRLECTEQVTNLQVGVHALGCGFSQVDPLYILDCQSTLDALSAIGEVAAVPDTVALPKRPSEDPDADTLAWKESVIARDAVLASNAVIAANRAAYLKTPAVRQIRQADVAKMILDEEALEGMFEGHRFYDILRYQMQEGKANGSSTSVITIPAHITEKYGAITNMEGKPWYLSLPKR